MRLIEKMKVFSKKVKEQIKGLEERLGNKGFTIVEIIVMVIVSVLIVLSVGYVLYNVIGAPANAAEGASPVTGSLLDKIKTRVTTFMN